MKRILALSFVVTLVVLALQAPVAVADYTFTTETPLFKQEVNNWCGAATAQMILAQGNVDHPQSEVWNTIQAKNQDATFPYGTEPDGLALTLQALDGKAWSVSADGAGSQDAVIQRLMKSMVRHNRPVALLVQYSNNPASHWVVWTGFTSDINPLDGAATLKTVMLNDPWPKTEGWPGTHGETWTISAAELENLWLVPNPRGTTYKDQYVAVAPVLSYSGHIDDGFIGEGYQYVEAHAPSLLSDDKDVISMSYARDTFDIDGMDVTITDTLMTVNLLTDYAPGIVPGTTSTTTDYGDLFISVNGWLPDSEIWEYAFDFDTGALYDIRNAQDRILFSDVVYGDRFGTQAYRHGQEIEIDTSGLDSVGQGSAGDFGDYYALSFDISNMHWNIGDTLGFHWTMSCANDVIEGSVTAGVPEPSTLLLLGSGMLGVVALQRKRSKK